MKALGSSRVGASSDRGWAERNALRRFRIRERRLACRPSHAAAPKAGGFGCRHPRPPCRPPRRSGRTNRPSARSARGRACRPASTCRCCRAARVLPTDRAPAFVRSSPRARGPRTACAAGLTGTIWQVTKHAVETNSAEACSSFKRGHDGVWDGRSAGTKPPGNPPTRPEPQHPAPIREPSRPIPPPRSSARPITAHRGHGACTMEMMVALARWRHGRAPKIVKTLGERPR